MKPINWKKEIFENAAMAAFVYALLAFVEWDINAATWTAPSRLIFAVWIFILVWVMVGVVVKHQEKPTTNTSGD